MYKEQRERFFGPEPENHKDYDDPSIIARRIDIGSAEKNMAKKSMKAFLVSSLVFAVVFVGIMCFFIVDFHEHFTMLPFFVFFIIFLFFPFLVMHAFSKAFKVSEKAPIAIKANGEFAIDIFLDNGQRKSLFLRDITKVGYVSSGRTSIDTSRNSFSLPASGIIKIDTKKGESFSLSFVADGERAKAKLQEMIADASDLCL